MTQILNWDKNYFSSVEFRGLAVPWPYNLVLQYREIHQVICFIHISSLMLNHTEWYVLINSLTSQPRKLRLSREVL